MSQLHPIDALARRAPVLASFLDKLIHPTRESDEEHDPGRPFTPPPSQPSKAEQEDDDDDGPAFPMDPVPA